MGRPQSVLIGLRVHHQQSRLIFAPKNQLKRKTTQFEWQKVGNENVNVFLFFFLYKRQLRVRDFIHAIFIEIDV